ncbi:MAG: FtsX-like permease family protein [Bifidobacteriaceae bacterium]|jgi:putative ABC transport system permease protein|nr:FtsX-like permease family protein [Bifidobacteriaceae bacterium]
MLRLTWRLMRRHPGRLIAAGLAIVISTMFSTAALVAVDTTMTVIQKNLSASYGSADLVVVAHDHFTNGEEFPITAEQQRAMGKVAGVEAVGPIPTYTGIQTPYTVSTASGSVALQAVRPRDDAAFRLTTVVRGARPTGDRQIALDDRDAKRLGVDVGGTVTVTLNSFACSQDQDADSQTGGGDTTPKDVSSNCQPPAAPAGVTYRSLGATSGPNDATGLYTTTATVSGIVRGDQAQSMYDIGDRGSLRVLGDSGSVLVGPAALIAVDTEYDEQPNGMLVTLKPGARRATVAAAIEKAVNQPALRNTYDSTSGASIQATRVQAMTPVEAGFAELHQDFGPRILYVAILLVFAAIALLIAGLVIANTFQVLIAQRTRLLALLRLTGATRTQVRRSIRWEAAIMGAVGAVGGIVCGAAIIELTLLCLRRLVPDALLPSLVTLTPWALGIPLVAGIGTSLIAARTPARLATHVSPIAALRPVPAPTLRRPAGRKRLIASLAMGLGGAVCAVAAVIAAFASSRYNAHHSMSDMGQGVLVTAILLLGIAGAGACVVGVILGTVFWVPKLVGRICRALGRFGPAARVAAANTVRNPRRTSATAAALIIGVALIATVSAGAASARVALTDSSHEDYGYAVGTEPGLWFTPSSNTADTTPITNYESVFPNALAAKVSQVNGIGAVLAGRSGLIHFAFHTPGEPAGLETSATTAKSYAPRAGTMPVLVIDPAVAAKVFPTDTTLVKTLRAGKAAVSLDWFVGDDDIDVADPVDFEKAYPTLTLAGDLGQKTLPVSLDQLTFPVGDGAITTEALAPIVISTAEATSILSAPTLTDLWASMAPKADSYRVMEQVKALTAQYPDQWGDAAYLGGWAAHQYDTERGIDLAEDALMVLLGVAVLIALVGVANTLSLSVLERRRETALLRALGLTRRRSARSVGIEGLFTALFGAVCGLILGTAFGCGVVYMIEGFSTDPGQAARGVAVAPLHIVAVLVLAAVAGVVASVVPARANGRIDPALALASE